MLWLILEMRNLYKFISGTLVKLQDFTSAKLLNVVAKFLLYLLILVIVINANVCLSLSP